MALVTPLLLMLLFGAAEVGNYFYVEHITITAVRDGARFASRQPFNQMECGTPTAATRIQNMVRTGSPTGSGTARIWYWTSTSGIAVTVECPANTGYSGIYNSMAQVPRVLITATVPYQPVLQSIGLINTSLSITAGAQAAVLGA